MPTATSKHTKKRAAPAQSGPKSKKPHLETTTEPQTKKRSRPVTATIQESEDESSDGGSEDEFAEDNDLVDGAGEDVGDEMEVAAPKDPNGALSAQAAHFLPNGSPIQLRENRTKPSALFLTNGKRRNPTLPSSPKQNVHGLSHDRKPFPSKSARNTYMRLWRPSEEK